jgi:transcriptional regulator with XRE-family HTH domain
MAIRPAKSHHKVPRTCPFDRLNCVYPCFQLVHARMSANLTDEDVTKKLDISRSTWWRYRRGHQKPPKSVCSMLHILAGHLPWAGWRNCFINHQEEKLYIDNNQLGITLTDLRGYWWKLQMITALNQKLEKQRNQIRDLICGSNQKVGGII